MIPLEVIALSPYAREWVVEYARRRASRRFYDRRRRVIELGEWSTDDWDGLLAMYRSFDPPQRAGASPPLSVERRAVWLEQLLSRGPNVVARASGRIVGHAALVAYDGGDSHELVVYVHRDYRGAGIGGALVDAVLQVAQRQGVERVWLTVERDNHSAARLYHARGFRNSPEVSAESLAAASWGVEVWTLALSDVPRKPGISWSGAVTALRSASGIRLRALADAVRFVMIPLVCAIVIAIASEDPRGRTLAVVLALASLGFGLVIHGRRIVFGESAGDQTPNDSPMSTGEWLASLR